VSPVIRYIFIFWVVGVTLILTLVNKPGPRTAHTRTFCAYGNVFVEFDEDGYRWGTVLLNQNGKPIPCKEDDDITEPANDKSIELKGINI
jgi:hypothetical protein